METLLFFRFAAISLIFLHHINLGNGSFGAPPVTFFFVLSGFTLGFFYMENFKRITRNDVLFFYKKRMSKIFPLHIAALFLCSGMYTIIHFPKDNVFYTGLNLFLVHSWFPIQEHVFSYNGVSWFLSTLFFLYLMTPYLLNISLKWKWGGRGASLAAIVYLSGAVISSTVVDVTPFSFGWWFIYISPYMRCFDYFLGILLSVYLLKSNYNIKNKSFIFCSIGELISLVLVGLSMKGNLYFPLLHDSIAFRYDLYHVPAVLLLIFFFFHQKGIFSKLINNKFFCYLGKISFVFYIFHQIVITFFMNVYSPSFMGYGESIYDFQHIVSQLFLYVMVILISEFIYRVINYQWKIKK